MKNLTNAIFMAFSLLLSTDGMTLANNSAESLADSVVWKITGPDLSDPSYLAGTIHMMCQRDFSLDTRFQSVIDHTNQLYLELDFDDHREMALLQKAMFTDQSLKDRLSEIQYHQLAEYLKNDTNLRIEQMDQLSFMAIQATLLLNHLNCPIKSLELELSQQAKISGKEVFGLETAAEQIKITEVFIPALNEKPWTTNELKYYLGDHNSFNTMLKLYQQQDITSLFQLINKQMNGMENQAHIKSTLLDERNKNWVAKMPGIMKKTATLFAIGSGHLAGDQGVINLLRKAGYTVEPVIE